MFSRCPSNGSSAGRACRILLSAESVSGGDRVCGQRWCRLRGCLGGHLQCLKPTCSPLGQLLGSITRDELFPQWRRVAIISLCKAKERPGGRSFFCVEKSGVEIPGKADMELCGLARFWLNCAVNRTLRDRLADHESSAILSGFVRSWATWGRPILPKFRARSRKDSRLHGLIRRALDRRLHA